MCMSEHNGEGDNARSPILHGKTGRQRHVSRSRGLIALWWEESKWAERQLSNRVCQSRACATLLRAVENGLQLLRRTSPGPAARLDGKSWAGRPAKRPFRGSKLHYTPRPRTPGAKAAGTTFAP